MQNTEIPDILNLQNCFFMYQIQHSPKLSASFTPFHAKDKALDKPLDIPLTKTNMHGKNSIKNSITLFCFTSL